MSYGPRANGSVGLRAFRAGWIFSLSCKAVSHNPQGSIDFDTGPGWSRAGKGDPVHARISKVCVYCGSSFGGRAAYRDAAETLGRHLAEAEIRLIYGGGGVGLMGALAEAVLNAGGRVTGIIPDFLDRAEVALEGVTELIRTDTMHERKFQMAEMADGFVVLPGGLGTLDETFEILTWKQLQLHDKPIILVNVDGYWDHFVHLVEHQVREGFVRERYLHLFRIVEGPGEVIPALLEAASEGITTEDRLDRI